MSLASGFRAASSAILADREPDAWFGSGGPALLEIPATGIMASEIVRAENGRVAAIGGNAIRDHDYYLVPLLFAGPEGGLREDDVGTSFDVRDTGLFFSCPGRLRLERIAFGEINTAVFVAEDHRAGLEAG